MIAAFAMATAELCPHPASRRHCTLFIFPEDAKPQGLCLTCKTSFDRLITKWDAGEITEAKARAVMAALGWSREDATAFIEQTLKVAA